MVRESAETRLLLDAIGGLGPLARQLSQAHNRLWNEQVHEELTGPQFTVLSLLQAHGDMDQGTLGARAHLDKSTAAPLLERLHRRGLVELTRDERDRRRKLVRITAEGRDLAARVAPTVVAVSDQLLEPFSAEERRLFLDLLHRAIRGQEESQHPQ